MGFIFGAIYAIPLGLSVMHFDWSGVLETTHLWIIHLLL